ncbi:MAG: hypothetical protein KIT10_05260 [Flavobacteriales bacterium]|nr:hypothetical protein [Flavobacteriales bacterium]
MSNYKFKGNAFKYNRVGYYRGKAEDIMLGCYGSKRSSMNNGTYLDVGNKLPVTAMDNVQIHTYGPIAIDWSKVAKGDLALSGTVKYIKGDGAKADLSHSSAAMANLVLMKFIIYRDQLRDAVNDHAPKALSSLASGSDGRLVSAIWVAMEGRFATEVTTEGRVEFAASQQGFDIKIKAGKSSTVKSTVTIGTNSTFAYMLHKVVKWGSRKKVIEKLKDDPHG